MPRKGRGIRIIITGERSWYAPQLAKRVMTLLVAKHGRRLVIVHGADGGIDRSFAEACRKTGVGQEVHPAEWDRYGRENRPLQNCDLVRSRAQICLAFHRNIARSRATKDCVRQALAAGIPTWLVDAEEARPARLAPGDPRLR